MTTKCRASVRLVTRHSLLVTAVLAVGCSQQQAAENAPAPADQPTVVIAPQPVANLGGDPKVQPAPVPAPAKQPDPKPEPKPEAPGPTFAFAADQTGKALPRVVAPDVSRPLPADKAADGPKPRAVPDKVLDPDPTARASYLPPPLLPPKSAAGRPANPAEKVPVNFGAGADTVPAKPVLPVAPVVTERAKDVNVPPPAPALGRPASDRVGFDDPTGDLANAAVVANVVKTSLAVSGFLKVTVPDPFELGEHVKPKVPAAAEPSVAPVVVNPQRVK